ncbi:MAG: PQQ-binding-like beta-propeller repeat protein [Planctomycetia bacterium]|jgi:outer membrane protein assembly factor BamB
MSRWASLGFWVAVLAFFVGMTGVVDTNLTLAADSPLISETRAAQHGLERQWHTQITIDPGSNRVTHLVYVPKSETCPDTLFVQTERATVFAINAETGKTLWSRLVGRPYLMSEPVGCNDLMVGVLNGSTLTMLDRASGRILWAKAFTSVPASGPVLSKRFAYVPYNSGCIAAYPIRKGEDTVGKPVTETEEESVASQTSASNVIPPLGEVEPLLCTSLFRIENAPVLFQNDVMKDRLAWINRKGLYVGSLVSRGSGFKLDYSLSSARTFASTPAFVPSRYLTSGTGEADAEAVQVKNPFGALVVSSKKGHVTAIRTDNGGTLWEYQLGEPIVNPAVAIQSRAYVISEFGLMICFDVPTGKILWTRKNASQFVAQTKDRLYVLNQLGDRLLILRASDGSRFDQLTIPGFTKVVANDKTDRMFFATDTGFIQSLRQRGQKEPVRYR